MSGAFIYGDAPSEARGPMKGYENWDANKGWCGHAYNRVVLAILSAGEPHMHRKMQAEKELLIGERKCAWWERHPNFDAKEAGALFKHTYRMEPPTLVAAVAKILVR